MSKQIIVGPDWDQRVVTINPEGKICLLMSGGIDSWVLYHILKQYKPDIIVIDRQDGFDNYKRVEELTGVNVTRLSETTTDPNLRIRQAILELEKQYDQVYMGLNRIPPSEHFPELQEDAPYRPWKITPPSKVIAPFLQLYKYHIIDYAQENNIDLSNTLSCLTSTKENCGLCWQCREKAWAYEQLK